MKNEAWLAEGLFTVHGKEVEQLFRQAVAAALWRHKQLGQSVAALRDGKVVIMAPEEIVIDQQLSDLEIIKRSAERLNQEARDALQDQIEL
jgi:hypothetical protein